MQQFDIDTLSSIATGRADSPFARSLAEQRYEISSALAGARVLVVGGAGSIGSATVKLLADHETAALHICDISENYLADLVRSLRNRQQGVRAREFRTFTCDYGGQPMRHLLEHERPYDFVLSFAAHKHVRGERDGFTLLSMVETNILKLAAFKSWATTHRHGCNFFCVSTDKAANPASLMGASKRAMENVLFEHAPLPQARVTTARFANVAFSNGSLLQAFLGRLAMGEPLAVPEGTRRYFVSPAESGELCLLASVLGAPGTIAIPDLDPEAALVELQSVAEALLVRMNLEPVLTRSEGEARLLAKNRNGRTYPILLTPLDTGGEKPFEEFVAIGETDLPWLPGLRSISHRTSGSVEALLTELSTLLHRGGTESDIAAAILAVFHRNIDQLSHRASRNNLDQRL